MRKTNSEINVFILQNLRENPRKIIQLTVNHFGITRQTVNKHINNLIKEKKIEAVGNTKAREYSLLPLSIKDFSYKISENISEDIIWKQNIASYLKNQSPELYRTCMYCFTEICNNAINHSEGEHIWGNVTIYGDQIQMKIEDDGIGIFNKIQKICNLDDPMQAVFELSKGKLTTEPHNHTGEGIFFVSRICNEFAIISQNIYFGHKDDQINFILEQKSEEYSSPGTGVIMGIYPHRINNMQKVFDDYSTDNDNGFSKTVVPIFLAQYGFDNLVSRSQARRIMSRFEKFKTVVLDFQKVDFIGQSFADEIFRVFVNEHPDIKISYINANNKLKKILNHVTSNN
ncbi:MAG: STAS-like domain-containing protein [Anaerolineaceae bacterium]